MKHKPGGMVFKTTLLITTLFVGICLGYAWNAAQHRIPRHLLGWTVRSPESSVALYCPQWRARLYGTELAQDAGGVTATLLDGDKRMIHVRLLSGTYSEDIEPQVVTVNKGKYGFKDM